MIHLHLQPELEAKLTAEAEAQGLPLDRYIESIVTQYSLDDDNTDSYPELDEPVLAANLQQGLREIAEGNTLPAEQVFAELHTKYGIRG